MCMVYDHLERELIQAMYKLTYIRNIISVIAVVLSSPGWPKSTKEICCFSVHMAINGVQLPAQDTGKQLTHRSFPTPVQPQ